MTFYLLLPEVENVSIVCVLYDFLDARSHAGSTRILQVPCGSTRILSGFLHGSMRILCVPLASLRVQLVLALAELLHKHDR